MIAQQAERLFICGQQIDEQKCFEEWETKSLRADWASCARDMSLPHFLCCSRVIRFDGTYSSHRPAIYDIVRGWAVALVRERLAAQHPRMHSMCMCRVKLIVWRRVRLLVSVLLRKWLCSDLVLSQKLCFGIFDIFFKWPLIVSNVAHEIFSFGRFLLGMVNPIESEPNLFQAIQKFLQPFNVPSRQHSIQVRIV